MKTLFVLLLWLSVPLFASPLPNNIPRVPAKQYTNDALFEGGKEVAANLEGLRFAGHGGFERWVVDFSDNAQKVGAIAPRFQIRYEKAETIPLPEGGELVRKPARFIFVFRQIQKNLLSEDMVRKLARKSRFVKEILLYPPIEKGDMAMEFLLKDNVQFSPHQPLEREGRLVLDLKKVR